jgi:hypothetical protein
MVSFELCLICVGHRKPMTNQSGKARGISALGYKWNKASKSRPAKIMFTISQSHATKLFTEIFWAIRQTTVSNMAAVYKSLSKSNGHKDEGTSNGVKKNKQKVLILSSRGVTYRLDILVAAGRSGAHFSQT